MILVIRTLTKKIYVSSLIPVPVTGCHQKDSCWHSCWLGGGCCRSPCRPLQPLRSWRTQTAWPQGPEILILVICFRWKKQTMKALLISSTLGILKFQSCFVCQIVFSVYSSSLFFSVFIFLGGPFKNNQGISNNNTLTESYFKSQCI